MHSQHSSDPPRTPTSRTWTTSSYSRQDSYSTDDASSDTNMRRLIPSPSHADDDDSNDAEEVEAALAEVDHDQVPSAQNAFSDWPSQTMDPHNFERRVLSMIAERTEASASRPSSFQSSAHGPPRPASATSFSSPIMRPENPAPRSMTPSSLSQLSMESIGARNLTPERPLRHTPGRRTNELVAFFEDRSSGGSSSSMSSLGQPRASHLRSPTFSSSPSGTGSVRLPADTAASHTFPRSTTLLTLDSRSGSPTKSAPGTLSSLLSPPLSGASYTESPQLSNFGSPTKILPRVLGAPRSPLSTVRNIVAAWKERTPSIGKSSKHSSLVSEPHEQNFFSIRRRDAVDTDRSLPPLPVEPLIRRKSSSNGNGRKSVASTGGNNTKTPFDISELGPFAQPDREPLRLGQLWYLNVHAPSPYRWIRTQAILYPHSLVLSWIAPGGGRGVVTLDLLNCNEVRSVPSPSHPSARDDIGTIAARDQASLTGPESTLVEMLSPFQLLYPDGVERLGAESARERVRWVGAIWEALNRSVSLPDASIRSPSPVPSMRTIRSESSSGSDNRSKSGSSSTVFVPPLDTLPDISSIASSASSRSSLVDPISANFSDISFHHRRASDDAAISGAGMLMPLERSGSRVIAPSRASSLRRTSSLENLDADFATARSLSTPASVGKPVTVSSGFSSSGDVFVSPPPSAGKKSRVTSAKSSSDSDNSVYLTPPRLSARTTPTSSYYSVPSTPRQQSQSGAASTPLRASRTLSDSPSLPNIVASTLSLRSSRSASLLGDSHQGDASDSKSASSHTPSTPSKRTLRPEESSGTTPTKSTLTRSPGVRRKTPRRSGSHTSSSSFNTAPPTLEGSDKENETAQEPFVASGSPRTPTERSYRSVGVLETTSTSRSRLATPPRTATSEHRTRTGRTSSYSSSIGYDLCQSSDMSELDSSYPETLSARSVGESSATRSVSVTSDVFLSASQGTSSASARTPSPTSTRYTTASHVPSSTEYNSLSASESSHYQSVETCPCSTEFQTATVCSSGSSTQFVTAELCAPTISTPSISSTASYQHTPPMPHSPTPTISSPAAVVSEGLPSGTTLESSSESISVTSSSRPPSSMGTIPSLPETISSVSFIPSTRLTPTTHISTVTQSEPEPVTEPSMSESVQTPSSTSLISPTSSEMVTPSETSTMSPSTISVTSTTSVSISPLTPVTSLTPTDDTYDETTGSYSSSVLQPSPSTASFVLPDPFDTSFETSFLRPSGSIVASETRHRIPMTPTQSSPRAILPPTPKEDITPSEVAPLSTETTPRPTPRTVPVVTLQPTTPSVSTPTTVSLFRTPSSVSSISMHSSILSPSAESLYDFQQSSLMESSSWLSSPSTESSVTPDSLGSSGSSTATPSQTSSSSTPVPPSSPSTPIPRSPTATTETTDAPTFSVSISTPYSNVPSIASQIDTIPFDTASETVAHDVDRLLSYLQDIDHRRDGQYGDLSQHLNRIERELQQLASVLNSREAYERPPPVPVKDVSVGRSSQSQVSVPAPRQLPPTTYVDVSPLRSLSPSMTTTSMSWLSSHYSDDLDRESENINHLLSSDSSQSTETARPTEEGPEQPSPLDVIRETLQRLVEQAAGLHEQHNVTHRLIQGVQREASQRHPTPAVVHEVPVQTSQERTEMIDRIERRLQDILDRLGTRQASSDTSSDMSSLLRGVTTSQAPRIHAPAPSPVHPPLSDLLSSFMQPDAGHRESIHLDPLPTIRVPHERIRPRSFSPPPPRRAMSVPAPAPDGSYSQIPPFHPPESPESPVLPPLPQTHRGIRRRPSESVPGEAEDIDMQRAVRQHRERRRADTDNGVFIPPPRHPPSASVPPRVGTAPAELAAPVASWGRRRQPTQAEPTPSTRGTTQGVTAEMYSELLGSVRNGAEFAEAAVAQARSTNRYLADLNEWLSNDREDRLNEMRALGARIDALRNELAPRLGIRPTFPPGFVPAPEVRGGPPFMDQAGRPRADGDMDLDDEEDTVIPPRPGILRASEPPRFPGFFPQPAPPMGWMPPPGFFPQGYRYPYPPPDEFAYEDYPAADEPWEEAHDRRFVPSRRRLGDESPILPQEFPGHSPSRVGSAFSPVHSVPAGPRPAPEPSAPRAIVIRPPSGESVAEVAPSAPHVSHPSSPRHIPEAVPPVAGAQPPIVIVPPPQELRTRSRDRRSRSRSRSPSRERDRSARSSRREPSYESRRSPPRSRHPSHLDDYEGSRPHSAQPPDLIRIRTTSRSPRRTSPQQIVISQRHRTRSRSEERGPTVIVRSRSRSHSSEGRRRTVILPETRSRSRSRRPPSGPQIIVQPRSHSRGRDSGQRQTIVVPRERSHSRDRPPETVIMRPRSESYSSEGRRRTVILPENRSRSRSRRSPGGPQIIVQPGSRSRARDSGQERTIIVPRDRSHSRDRPPETVIMRPRSESYSPEGRRRTVILPETRSRSRSRPPSGPQIILEPRSRSRGRDSGRERTIVVPRDRSYSRDRPPETVIMRPRSESYSPEGRRRTVILPETRSRPLSRASGAQIITVPRSRSRGRDSGRERTIVVPRDRSYSRDRFPERERTILVPETDRRGRSQDRQSRVIFAGPRSRSVTPERPITVIDGHRSRGSRAESPRTIVVQRSPSRHSSVHPSQIVLPDSRSSHRTAPIYVSRPDSRSHAFDEPIILDEGGDDGHRTPTVIHRGRSPSRSSQHIVVQRSPSRYSRTPTHVTRARSRSYSPVESGVHVLTERDDRRHSQPTVVHVPDRSPSRTQFISSRHGSPPRTTVPASMFEEPRLMSRAPSRTSRRDPRELSEEDFGPQVPRSPDRIGHLQDDVISRPRSTHRESDESQPAIIAAERSRSRGGYRSLSPGEETGERDGPPMVVHVPSGPRSRASGGSRVSRSAAPSRLRSPPPSDGSRPPSDGSRPPSDGSRPPSGGSRPSRGAGPSDIHVRPPAEEYDEEGRPPTIIPPDEVEGDFPGRIRERPHDFQVPEDARGMSPPTGSPSSSGQRGTRSRASGAPRSTQGSPPEGDRAGPSVGSEDVDHVPPGARTPEVGGPVESSGEDPFSAAFNNAEDERRMRYAEAERNRDGLFHEREETRHNIFDENERAREERAEAAMRDLLRAAAQGTGHDEHAPSEGLGAIDDAIDTEHPASVGSLQGTQLDPEARVSVVPSGFSSAAGTHPPPSEIASVGPSVRDHVPSDKTGSATRSPPRDLQDMEAEAAQQEALRDQAAMEAESIREGDAALSEAERTARSERVHSGTAESVRSMVQSIAEERASLQHRLEAAERERAEMLTRLQDEHEERLNDLKLELEQERTERRRIEAELQQKCEAQSMERDAGLRDQLADITTLLQEKKDECEQWRKLDEERNLANADRRSKKDADFETLREMVKRIVNQNEAMRTQEAEDRVAQAAKPGVEAVLEALEKQKQEQTALLNSVAEGWQSTSQRHHEEILERVKESAREQVPFNVQQYLEIFSQKLADEVRLLLHEVGRLREEKRNIQFELGSLLRQRSRYGPGGEYDPDWHPNIPMYGGPPGPPPPGGPPAPDAGPPPGDLPPQAQAKPAWRNVNVQPPRLSKRQRRQMQKEAEEAAAAEAAAQAGPSIERASWATWMPDPGLAPTPASQQAELVSPGLFGPRSPRSNVNNVN